MPQINNNTGRYRTPIWLIAGTLVLPALIVAASLVQTALPIDQLYRDTVRATASLIEQGHDLQAERIEPLIGAISNLGALLWCLAAVVCLFAATLVQRQNNARVFACLVCTGLFSAALMFDDLFLAHESLYPTLFGLSEKRLFAGYALLMVVYIIVFWPIIRRYALGLFLISASMMVASLVCDVLDQQIEHASIPNAELIQRLGEDGLKLIAIFAWASFSARLSWLAVQESA